MLKTLKILKKENIVNIKELQKSPSRHLKSITRIQKGATTLGFFLDEKTFNNLIEDFEAIQSPKYIQSILKARKENPAFSLNDVKKHYGI